MKKWMRTVSVVIVFISLAACSTNKEDAPGKSENDTKSERTPQKTAKPADAAEEPAGQWPSQQPPDQDHPGEIPPNITLETPDDDQGDDSEVAAPKSRVFGAIGRAFFGGATSRDSDDPESQRDQFDENQ